MIAVMGVMAASSLFVAAAFAAANGDLPLTRDSQDRKQAYAAAEAGINYYQYHLNQDSDYWTRCINVPPPNAHREAAGQPEVERRRAPGGPPPLAQGRRDADGVHDRAACRRTARPQCVEGDQTTMIDPATGSFKIRATGRPRADSKLKRTLVAQFRRRSFLDFLYFTEFETTDPIAYTSAWQALGETNCGDKPRALRATSPAGRTATAARRSSSPTSTTSRARSTPTTTSSPAARRPSGARHRSPTRSSSAGRRRATRSSADPARATRCSRPRPRRTSSRSTMPPTNETLEAVAKAGGTVFNGETWIKFRSDGTMDVRNKVLGGSCYTSREPGHRLQQAAARQRRDLRQDAGDRRQLQHACRPSNADYAMADKCGNLYVSGDYTKSMTLAGGQRHHHPALDEQLQGRRPERDRQRGHGPHRPELRARLPPVLAREPDGVADDSRHASTRRSSRSSTPSRSTTTTAAPSSTS